MFDLRTNVPLGIIFLVAACGGSGAQPSPSEGGTSAGGASAGIAGLNAVAGASGSAMGGVGGSASSTGGSAGLGGASGGGGVAAGGGGGVAAGGKDSAGAGGSGGDIITCKPPADVFSPIENLSLTGCVDPTDPRKPAASAITYEVNSPLWSDSADKARAFVLPAGAKIHVRDCVANASDCPGGSADEGRWDYPVGTVMIKIFSFDAKVVETRLFMHLNADNWVGYSYQWDEAQSGAKIVSSAGASVTFNTGARSVPWRYPSQDDCLNCHNHGAGSTLGPETAQMNRVVGGMNQLDRFASLGLFETAPTKPYKPALVTPYTSQAGSPTPGATTEQRARSYLHANCGFCHRPGGNFANFDLRNDTSLKDMGICNVASTKGAIASAPGKTTLMAPGKDMDSLMWLRMNVDDPLTGRMPQIASYVVDTSAVTLVGDWINSVNACPQ